MSKGKDIGALWVKRSPKGEYLSGYIEIDGKKHSIVCFLNGYKKEQKHPDYKVYPSEPRMRTDAEDRAYDRQADAGSETQEVPRQESTQEQDDFGLNDIPF